jgi:hypothetical protein
VHDLLASGRLKGVVDGYTLEILHHMTGCVRTCFPFFWGGERRPEGEIPTLSYWVLWGGGGGTTVAWLMTVMVLAGRW